MGDSKRGPQTSGKVRFFMMFFIRIMLLLAFVVGLQKERYLVLFVAVFAFFVTFLPRILERIRGVSVPAEFEIMVLLFIYGVLFLGDVRGFYAEYWWWDVILNFGASIALGFIGLTILYVLYKEEVIDASPLVVVILAFCFAFAIGGLWEIFEYILDNLFGFALQQGSLQDTMEDLIVNAIGALLVSVAGYVYMRTGEKNIVSGFIMKFMLKNPKLFKSKKHLESSADKITRIIKKGESERLEFKSSLRTNLHTGEFDKKVENAVLKTIVAYLNTHGGTLLVGVSDSGNILGLEKDKFPNNDKLNLYFTNMIKHHIGNEFLPYIDYELFPIEDKHVLKVECKESSKRVFLKEGQEEEFYVRNGPSSAKLTGSALLDYVENKFGGS